MIAQVDIDKWWSERMNLPPRQQQLFDLLFGKGDVSIDDLFAAMRGEDPGDVGCTPQRWLSPYIGALNRNLTDKKLKVEPGALKGSYRMVAMTT